MSIQPTTKTVPTDEELMALPKDGYKRELLDGEIVMSPARSQHGRQILRFAYELMKYAYDQKRGELYDGQTGFRMSTGDVLCPDLAFVSLERLPEVDRGVGLCEGGPDLVIEFLSPSESKKRIQQKLNLYFSNSVKLAWIVDSRNRTVAIYRDARNAEMLPETATLTADNVLPGFSASAALLFADILQ
jgi:Uma2 family endonuclease